jgi:hypothetical protein
MASVPGYTQVNGNGSATNASSTTSIIAAQGAGKVLRITRGTVSVTTVAVGGGGLVQICNGTTAIMQWDANAVKDYYFDFGDIGFPLTANTAFQLIVTGAVTTQASASCAATAIVA